MQLIIEGRRYDLIESLSKPTLNDLYYLKVKTKSEEYPAGVSLKSMVPVMLRMAEISDDPAAILDDPELLLNLRALVFLCRRHAGERLSFDEANDFPISEFSFESEDSDSLLLEGATPDPQ